MTQRNSYFRVFQTFARNSMVRDMMFPANFIIETLSSFGWVMMNIGFYLLIFEYTTQIGGSPSVAHETAAVSASAAAASGSPAAAVATSGATEAVNASRVSDGSAWDKHQFFVFIA